MATINGNNNANSLGGTSSADKIYGFDGNDALRGNGGADVLYGGNGNDTLTGDGLGDGADNARDILYGGAGNDLLVVNYNDRKNDQLYGEAGSDTFRFYNKCSGTIMDFQNGVDKIDLTFNFSYGKIQFSKINGGADVLAVYKVPVASGFDLTEILIKNTALSAIDSSDFI